ncbi:MAG: hypothetical protein IPM49_10190 [Flavobacteriales bacterium]|nr:hypothetical protein [Flavobacteriales bacterium]
MRTSLLFFFVCSCITAFAQGVPRNAAGSPVAPGAVPTSGSPDTARIRSEHGWYLSPHGTLRVLVLFAEVVYDKDPARDPQPDGAAHWPKGRLPLWKDEVFDPQPLPVPKAMVTRYYHDISLGRYTVLGDHVDQLLRLRQSEHGDLRSANDLSRAAVAEANKLGALRTAHRLSVADFDLWKDGRTPGVAKEAGPDGPHSYDHVMLILRNSGLTHGQGSTDPGSSGALYGYESDTQSRFGGMNALPFEILKHEFNHLLLGGNNFHSGGGNASNFQSHFIPLQGGHSMMGAASSALLTCSGWDRDRLGWRADGAPYRINARTTDGRWTDGDLDPAEGDTGVYVLRDFVTTGDAIRIRLPYLPADVHPQWLWLENHLGFARNGSPTDRFHWEADSRCIDPVEPGVFALVQVAHEERAGKDTYQGHADYLRAVPATGLFDLELRGDTLSTDCPFGGGRSMPFFADSRDANPLSGGHELELPVYDRNGDGRLDRREHYIPGTRIVDGRTTEEAVFFGRPEHAFRMIGNRALGLATNPGTANLMTLVSAGGKALHKGGAPDARLVVLNGLRVELLAQAADGAATVRVRTDDNVVDREVRWCADSIVLPPLRGRGGVGLSVEAGARLLLDRSATPTRVDRPEEADGRTWFSAPTRFVVTTGATLLVRSSASLELVRASELHVLSGATLRLEPGARVQLDRSSRIVLHGDAVLELPAEERQRLEKRGRIERREGQ